MQLIAILEAFIRLLPHLCPQRLLFGIRSWVNFRSRLLRIHCFVAPPSRTRACLGLFLSPFKKPLRLLRARTSCVRSNMGLLPLSPMLPRSVLHLGLLFLLNVLGRMFLVLLLELLLFLSLLLRLLMLPGRGFVPVGAIRRGLAPLPEFTQKFLGDPRRPGRHGHHVSRPSTHLLQSSPSFSSPSFGYSSFGGTPPYHQILSPGSSCQKDHQRGYFSSPSFLFPPFCSDKKGWAFSSYNRPFHPQQVPSPAHLPHGVSTGHSVRHCGPTVGLHGRPEGRLLSRAHGMVLPRLSGLPSRWENLRLSVSSLRSRSGALGLSQGDSPNQGLYSQAVHQVSYLPGRLPGASSYPGWSETSNLNDSPSPLQVGHNCELQEVSSFSFTDCRVSRGGPSLRLRSSLSSLGKGSGYFQSVPVHSFSVSSLSKTVGEPLRTTQLCGPPSQGVKIGRIS